MKNFVFLLLLASICCTRKAGNPISTLTLNESTQEYLKTHLGEEIKVSIDTAAPLQELTNEVYTGPCLPLSMLSSTNPPIDASVSKCQVLPGIFYTGYSWWFTGLIGNGITKDEQWKNLPILLRENHPKDEKFYARISEVYLTERGGTPMYILVEI